MALHEKQMADSFRHIIVIQSLFIEDDNSGEDLYNDIIKRYIDYNKKSIAHQFHRVSSKEELAEILRYIDSNAIYIPGGIVIHFEIHGSEGKDGLILSDRSLITWKELITFFREINIKTDNRLYITLATCYGRYLFEGVDSDKKSPYSGYISDRKY